MKESQEIEKVYSVKVKAGRRKYYFDIKPTKSGDYYLVITESKWSGSEDSASREKHRIFLYKEDLNKFGREINKAIDYIKSELMPEYDFSKFDRESEDLLKSEVNKEESKVDNEEESEVDNEGESEVGKEEL